MFYVLLSRLSIEYLLLSLFRVDYLDILSLPSLHGLHGIRLLPVGIVLVLLSS